MGKKASPRTVQLTPLHVSLEKVIIGHVEHVSD